MTDLDLKTQLYLLGKTHQQMGVTRKHIQALSDAFDTTMMEYYKSEYSGTIKDGYQTIFNVAAEFMMKNDSIKAKIKNNSKIKPHNNVNNNISKQSTDKRKDSTELSVEQRIVVFFHWIKKFDIESNHVNKYKIAKIIYKKFVADSATFHIDFSNQCKYKVKIIHLF